MTDFSDLDSVNLDYTIHGNFFSRKPSFKQKPRDLNGSPDISPCGTTFFRNFQAPKDKNGSNFDFAPQQKVKIRRIQTSKSIESLDLGETHIGSNQQE